MRPLIVSEFITLDGVVEAPGGEPTHPHSGWTIEFMSPEQVEFKLQETLDADALLLGRTTYESFAEAWPGRTGPFADKMNTMPKFVASTTLSNPAWPSTTVLDGDVPQAVAELKRTDGGPLLVAGSITLVRTLLEHELVDELRLMVFPVIVGGGTRLFPDDRKKATFTLVGAETFPSGVVVQSYRPATA